MNRPRHARNAGLVAGRARPSAAAFLALLAAAALPDGAAAQGSSTRFWVDVGAGIGVAEDLEEETAAVAEVVLQTGPHRFAARAAGVAEVLDEDVYELGLTYGLATTGERVHAALSAGAAYVSTDRCEGGVFNRTCQTETAVGVPITATLTFRPLGFLGLGVQAFGNLNTVRDFGGGVVVLELGAVR